MTDPIAQWLATLAGLLNPMYPGQVAAFTPATARDVAAAKRHGPVPAWDVIEPVIAAAVRHARPINAGLLPAPRIPDRTDPTPESLAYVMARVAEARAILSAPHPQDALRPAAAPLRDVSLTPDQLRETRKRAGIRLPDPQPQPTKEHAA
jgi:hypothetical protein